VGTLLPSMHCLCQVVAAQESRWAAAAETPSEVDAVHSGTIQTHAAEASSIAAYAMGESACEVPEAAGATSEIPSDIEEAFAKLCAGNERLKRMSECEVKLFTDEPEEQDHLPVNVRREVLCFFGFIVERESTHVAQDWFRMVTLVDILAVRTRMPLKDLPAQCAAIVSVVCKADAPNSGPWLKRIAGHATQLARGLREQGAATPDVITESMIFQHEKKIFGVLDGRVEPASCETWTSAFCARLSAIEGLNLQPSIECVWQNSLSCARWVCMQKPASVTFMPRCLALGTLCIYAVLAHLVPCGHVRPDQMEPSDWSQLFGVVPVAITTGEQAPRDCLTSLLIAMDTDLATLKQHTYTLLMLLGDKAQNWPHVQHHSLE